MSHVKIIASLLLLFFSIKGNAATVCNLLEKNVEEFKYSFKCQGEIVNIQCKVQDSDVCSVNIKSKLESMRFSITADELNSFNLFSTAQLASVECDTSKKVCKIEKDVCDKYQGFFEKSKRDIQKNLRPNSRCNGIIGDSLLGVANLSTEIVSQPDFKKNSCETKYALDIQTLKNKISFFNEIVNQPILDRESFLYGCVNFEKISDPKIHDSMVLAKAKQLDIFKNGILNKIDSAEYLASTVCESRSPLFFESGKLNVDNVMCAVFEESRLEVADLSITCNGSTSKVSSGASSRLKSAEESGARLANADTTPIEQKPMPEAMASQIGKPVGLAPALAQVDQIAPGSGTAQGSVSSESNFAAGAVRNTIPLNIASEAGKAFAPVYEKLSAISKSAGYPSKSIRPGIIGSGSSSLSSATGVVSVTRKPRSTSSDDSSGSIADIAGTASVATTSPGLAKASAGKSTDGGAKASLGRTAVNTGEANPALGGPRSLGLNSVGSGGSGATRSPSNTDYSETNTGTAAIVEKVQKKITQLNSPAQIASFFKEEAASIPNLRELLYSDATSRILASKGIRVVNQSGDESGETFAKAKYLYRDDGSKFTPLKMAKKN